MSERSKIIRFPGHGTAGGALEIRVELLLVPVPIWRRFLIPSEYSFWDLHVAIQGALGWEDRHLHQFTLDDGRSGQRLRFGIPDDHAFHGRNEVLAGWEHPVLPYLQVDGLPVLYTYDFGEDWQHEVVLLAIHEQENPAHLPRCLDGAGVTGDVTDGDMPARADFAPEEVRFDNPRRRWERAFGHD